MDPYFLTDFLTQFANITTEVRTAINVDAELFDVICVRNDPTIYAYVSVLAFNVNISIVKDHRLEFVRICE